MARQKRRLLRAQQTLSPMLFLCGRRAYRGVPATFIYAFVQPSPDQRQQLQHSIRYEVSQLQRLAKMRGPMTPEWLAASGIEAAHCILSNGTSLADAQSQRRRRPVVGNFTTFTFNSSETYEVRT